MTKLAQLLSSNDYDFPDPIQSDPSGMGLVAMGADLAPATLISAYTHGLFPWFNEDEPIAWWCPEPRCVITPTDYKPSKSLRRTAKRAGWHITLNRVFEDVIHACSLPRSYAQDTWIHEEMIEAYLKLHQLGFAHSIEVWQDDDTDSTGSCYPKRQLIGGLYGLKIGQIYFGESMFHTVTDASKVAFWALMRLCAYSRMPLIDCQLPNPHLLSLGAKTLARSQFLAILPRLIRQQTISWQAANFEPVASHKLLTDSSWRFNPS